MNKKKLIRKIYIKLKIVKKYSIKKTWLIEQNYVQSYKTTKKVVKRVKYMYIR